MYHLQVFENLCSMMCIMNNLLCNDLSAIKMLAPIRQLEYDSHINYSKNTYFFPGMYQSQPPP